MTITQRPPQQTADRIDDVGASDDPVRAAALGDVDVDDRGVETEPPHRPISLDQHVHETGCVVTARLDGSLGQATLLTHPPTPARHRRLGGRQLIDLNFLRLEVAGCR
jgi:hypothetical protein